MRLFAYYSLHSFINQIKKLFKTWVAILLGVSLVIGLVLGVAIAFLEDTAEETAAEEILEESVPFSETLFESTGLEIPQFAELIAGAGVLALLLLFVLLADKSNGSIFLPADAQLLFASPMKPQKVLLFRVMSKLGLALFMTIYFCIEIPMLKSWGMDTLTAFSVILAFGICFTFGMLLQVLFFLLGFNHPFIKKNLTYFCLGFVALIAAGFFAFYKSSGMELPMAAAAFFNSNAARLFPVWGWIKSIPFLFWSGNYLLAAAAILLSLGAVCLMLVVIDRTKADFYEEALARAEKLADDMEKIKANGGLFFKNPEQGKKKGLSLSFGKKKTAPTEDTAGDAVLTPELPEKESREVPFKGNGANVFFFKPMYLRRKFAKLGFFTKNTFTYLILAAGSMAISLLFLDSSNMLLSIAVLSAWAFFRTLGNPMIADVKTSVFRLAPGSDWRKMFWSVLAGSVNCLADLAPAFVLCAVFGIAFGGAVLPTVLMMLAGLLFAASLDFYSSTAGAFIQLSLPDNAGSTLKQSIQILFLYFGLLPDAGILAYGIIKEGADHAGFSAYVFIAIAFNLLLGLFFLAFCPLFLWPRSRSRADQALEIAPQLCKGEKKFFARAGFAVAALLAAANGVSMLLGFFSDRLPAAFTDSEMFFWATGLLPIYLVGVPVAWLILRKLPARRLDRASIAPIDLLKFFVVAEGLGYLANIVGNLFVLPTYIFSGAEYENVVETLTSQGGRGLQLLFIVVIGPFFEELVFRKMLIDRLNVYGGRLAVVTSAIMFGLFHGNIQQILYAAFIGFVFGYVYQKSGNILYSWLLHMLINLNGGFVSLFIIEHYGDSSWQLIAYIILLIAVALLSLVISAVGYRRLEFVRGEKLLPHGMRFRTVWLNFGMILLVCVSVAMAVLNIVLAI